MRAHTITLYVLSRVPGHLFDLNSLNRKGGYTAYDNRDPRKMFRLNVCGEMDNAGCQSGTGRRAGPRERGPITEGGGREQSVDRTGMVEVGEYVTPHVLCGCVFVWV